MITTEISDRLDYLLLKSNGGIVLDEYQKSLYLTSAQMELVELALGKYEYGDRLRHILGPLLVRSSVMPNQVTNTRFSTSIKGLSIMSIVWEKYGGVTAVIPLDYNDAHMVFDNPFKKPDENIAYRNIVGDNLTIYTDRGKLNYSYIYCREPRPIVLEDFSSLNLTVGGISTEQTSELSDSMVINVIAKAAEDIKRGYNSMRPQPPAQQQGGQEKK